MKLFLYNTLTKKKEEFQPLEDNQVRFYACGLTVYDYAHIGNLRTYIFEDILKRVLLYNNFKIKHVMNITDVGHLTGENLGDADSGEDKVEQAAKEQGKTPEEITRFYTEAFKQDLDSLHILYPDIWCKATEHVEDMIELIKEIEANGYTYTAGGNVYFDTSRFEYYEELANLKTDELKHGARVSVDKNKKNPQDFVLWFTKSEKFENHLQQWDSPWGRGWPGWHIECSAMSSKYLGKQFDIHTGGVDHVNVHHTNEIAQSEAAFGTHPWVRFWLHGEFLVMEKEKMSKSLGNFITLQNLIDKGFDPMHYRYFCFTAHYRKPLVFSMSALEGAKQSYENLRQKILNLKSETSVKKLNKTEEYRGFLKTFHTRINNDLNIPRALAVLYDTLKSDELDSAQKLDLVYNYDDIFGFNFREMTEETREIPEEILKLVKEREEARKQKDFQRADELRDIIQEKGYSIKDTPDGTDIN